jgi:hypothetical protein
MMVDKTEAHQHVFQQQHWGGSLRQAQDHKRASEKKHFSWIFFKGGAGLSPAPAQLDQHK